MSIKSDKKARNESLDSLDDSDKLVGYDTIVVHGTEYKTTLTKKYLNRKKWAKANPFHEVSYIPGTIRKMYIKDGETLKKGQPVLILEAMKMENTIFAPFDCKVAKVHVKVGEVLPKGTLLITYE